jgi:hypothetical protein
MEGQDEVGVLHLRSPPAPHDCRNRTEGVTIRHAVLSALTRVGSFLLGGHVDHHHCAASKSRPQASLPLCHTHRLRRKQQQRRQYQTRSHWRQRLQQRRRMHRRHLLRRRQRLCWSHRGRPSSWRPSACGRWPGAVVGLQAAGVPGRCLQMYVKQKATGRQVA